MKISDFKSLKNEEDECNYCNKIFPTVDELIKHIHSHYSSNNRPGLAIHYKKKGELICQICSSIFLSNSVLKEHVIKIHNDKSKIFKCDDCKEPCYFKQKQRYENHVKRHHSDNPTPFECEKCSKSFRDPHTLKRHLGTHGPKLLECEICQMKFNRNSLLQSHIRNIHTKKERIYKCEKCFKSYFHLKSLNDHMVQHSEDPLPFKCTELLWFNEFSIQCEKSFSRKSNLNLHMIQHSKDYKPFKCDICSSEFTRQKALGEHMYSHTDDPKPFKCLICDLGFTKSSSLYSHRKKRHNTENIELVKREM